MDASAAEAIEGARLRFADALRLNDAASAAAMYADDATLLAPAAEVLRGRSAIERFWRTGLESGLEDVRLVVLELRHRGEVAIEIGQYALRVASESGAVVDRGRYLTVHRMQPDGSWRRAAEMFGPDAATVPTTKEPQP
jgi:uncharacterized protein (TIGR02246 family)